MLQAAYDRPDDHTTTANHTHIGLRSLLVGLALFATFATLMALVQYGTPDLADNDGYYHMKMGAIVREQGLRPAFIWLPISILHERAFYDHHLLYHVYLALFVGDGSPAAMLLGAKLAAIVMPALAFTAIWWLLRGQQVPWASLWALGLCAISEAFLYRMSIPRAQSASLLVLALGLHWLLQRRYIFLLPLGFVYVWLYNAFPLLIVLVAAEALAALLTDRRLVWRGLAFAGAGIALGLVVNPYFPDDLAFIISHLLPKIGQPEVSVGNEWYPYQTWTLVENSGAALAALGLGAFALGWRGRRFDRATLTTFLLALFFALLVFKARRFVEYFPPFALIFAALTAGPLLKEILSGRADQERNRHPAGALMLSPRWSAWVRRMIAATLPLGLALLAALTIMAARESMAGSKPAATFAEASAWLRANTPAGSMVFQTDWDDFPRLFFYNSSNVYTIGLDPTYLQLYDESLYDQWVAITRGKVEHPAAIIRETFGARYVISDLKHGDFLRRAADDPRMREVFRDQYAVVYAIEE